MDRYNIVSELAITRAGDVLLCTERISGKQVVIKRVKVQVVDGAIPVHSMELLVHRELSQHGGHPNILKLLDDFAMDGNEYFVMEYCSNGELFDHVESAPDRRMDQNLVRSYFLTICGAVQFMHTKGFAHCDLSLENILVDNQGSLKLSDFGLSTVVHGCRQNLAGKLFYMAPEAHQMDAYDPAKADVWSLGVMLFIMLTGSPPFESSHSSDSSLQFVSGKGIRALCTVWQIDHIIPSDAMDLLEKMLVIHPSQRWSLDQVCKHSYLIDATLLPPTSHTFMHDMTKKACILQGSSVSV